MKYLKVLWLIWTRRLVIEVRGADPTGRTYSTAAFQRATDVSGVISKWVKR